MGQYQEDFYIIKLTLDDSFDRLQSQSSYDFGVKSLGNIELLVVAKPFIFKYIHPKYGFILPPGLFLGISLDNKHVTSVDVFPHLRYINMEEMLTLLRTLQQLFEQSGWQVSHVYHSLEEVRIQFTDTKRPWYKNIVGFQEWQNSQGDEIYIKIERNWKADEFLPKFSGQNEDYFTVRVVINNTKIFRQYRGLE
ncbi:MAG: hypothetical protein HC877_04255 [Thioploca sp.]|nr:hypothetical protein [Thioploca sp.]